ncbi:spexin prohormone 2 isoform X1 [Gadus morhua]|uniref:spexin prohormone 2 isoform X1 n=2 Tax=Gadus morhua TaxID=8049 RepID=UPI0011B4610B|nr:protein lin-54 homolog isoform X1 [Gadus morhua]
MEQGHYQDAEGICFSDGQPLIMGCVWTMQQPDAILPGNLPHPPQQHEPCEIVPSHCLGFSPVAGLLENNSHSSISLPWVAVGDMHRGMMPGELHNAIAEIGPSDSQDAQQCQTEHTNSPNNLTKMQQAVCPLYSETSINQGERKSEATGARMNATMRDSKSKKPCNCTKSQCLKRYCDCFANGEVCSNCNCVNCCNNAEHYIERHTAILNCLDRNPEAFKFNIVSRQSGEVKGNQNKDCNCKQSSCLKNYCECYKAKMMCSSTCKCVGCLNSGDDSEVKTRVRGRTEISSNNRMQKETCLPSLITLAVVADTRDCLLAQAAQAEREGCCYVLAQRMILQEFGRCLTKIVESV